MGEEVAAAIERRLEVLGTAWAPWQAEQGYLNFVEAPTAPSAFFDASTLARLGTVKAAYDPDDVVCANHPVRPRT